MTPKEEHSDPDLRAEVDRRTRLGKDYLSGYFRERAMGLTNGSVNKEKSCRCCSSDTADQMEMFWEAARVVIPELHKLYWSMNAGLRRARHEAIDQESKRRLQDIEDMLPRFRYDLIASMLNMNKSIHELCFSGEGLLKPGTLADLKNTVDSIIARAMKPRGQPRLARKLRRSSKK